jgi:UDP-N-acetylmuramoylalanine--D-glutamate ligase
VHGANVPVIGEIELAYRLCKAPMIAVTGTKGKSTTTALIGHLLRACGLPTRVGGNIGNPLITEVVDAESDEWVVAEVSSFQLETIRAFKPRVAVLLNLSPDHLDRYPSMEEYAEAKYRICANQSMNDWFVGNLDDPRIEALAWRHGGARVQAKQMWFTLGNGERATIYPRDGNLVYAPVCGDPRPIVLMPCSEIPLAGRHNVQNVMAALLAALAVGCDPAVLRRAVASFVPMPHRLERIAEIDGVLYVDDSKSTNPSSVIAALRSYDRPIVLIAGGRSKGSEFGELGSEIRRHVKALVAIGESAGEIRRAAEGVVSVEAATMEEAVHEARRFAVPGDVVLLSPGCASFDMFASAEDRGRRFDAAVASQKEPAGA